MSQNKLVIDEDGYILEMPVEKAIEILNPIFINPKVGRANGKTRTVFNQQIAWLTILGALREKQKEGQWISVEDRLPEDGMTVLTIDTNGKNEVCFYEKEWKGIFQQCGGLVKIYNITHWQPLPQPPKEADNV